MQRRLDVMRTSASRPELLKVSCESLAKYIRWSGTLRVIGHEDVLNRKASELCVHYMKNESPLKYQFVKVDEPPVTQIMSMTWLIEQMETEYFLNWEDDYEALRDIPLDDVVRIMDENPDVNQIAFHKRATMHNRYTFIKREVERSGHKLVTNPHWAFTPALWRRDFILKYWKPPYTPGVNPVWWLNPRIKQSGSMRSAKWIIENVGHYFMGQFQEPAFCYHIGGGKSLREGDYKFKD